MATETRGKSKKLLPLLLGAGLLLVLSSCCCCIGWVRFNEMEREDAASVGSAARILAVRDQLDRIHDAYPDDPAASACSESPPERTVPVLSLTQLATFRRGEGVSGADEGEVDLVDTHIHGHDRPADDISDADAYRQLDALVSPLRDVEQSPWVAVVRTREVRMPAVTFNTFLPGHFEGDVVVFERETGRVLCAQPLSATNTAEVDVGAFEGGSDAARRDLTTQLDAEKERARAALAPGLQLDW